MEAQLINQHLGARCTVLSQQNDFLFLGKLAQYNKTNQTLVIENLGGQRALWSDISPNMPVKLQINSRAEKDGLLLFEGIVDNSTQDSIAIRLSLAISKKGGPEFLPAKSDAQRQDPPGKQLACGPSLCHFGYQRERHRHSKRPPL